MPLQEAKNATYIKIKFRSQQENAFIFLAAGRTDYCLIQLDSGQIKLIFQIEDEQIEMSSNEHKLSDHQWHDISVHRFENTVSLQVDANITKKHLPPSMLGLNIHFGTYLGGFGEFFYEYLPEQMMGFRGCLSDVSVCFDVIRGYLYIKCHVSGLLQQHQCVEKSER